MKALHFFFLYVAGASIAGAQVYTPPPQENPPATDNRGGSRDTVINRQPEQRNTSPFLGGELPFLNPNSEMVSWNGSTWAATDNRLVAARFERYLNEPEDNSEEAQEYRKTIEEILEFVSPHHPGGPDFSSAVTLLPRASSFPGDAKLCDSLSQAIYAAVLAQKDVSKTRAINKAMEEEKRRLIADADWKADHETDPAVRQAPTQTGDGGANNGGANGPSTSPGRGITSLRHAEALRRLAEIEALKKSNTAKNEVQLVQAKIQYRLKTLDPSY